MSGEPHSSHERHVVATAPETIGGDSLVDAAVAETAAVVAKIEKLEAATFKGICVKELAWIWAQGLDPFSLDDGDAGDTTDNRLALRTPVRIVGWDSLAG